MTRRLADPRLGNSHRRQSHSEHLQTQAEKTNRNNSPTEILSDGCSACERVNVRVPCVPRGQEHLYAFMRSMQVPPFWQG